MTKYRISDWVAETALVKSALGQGTLPELRRLKKHIDDGKPLLVDGAIIDGDLG